LVLLAEVVRAQFEPEGAVLGGSAWACPGRSLAMEADLTRACRACAAAVEPGRAPVSGPAASFFASLESYEPSPVAGIATVSPSSRADRAAGELHPKTCLFGRIGVAAAELRDGSAVVCALTAIHGTTVSRIPGRVEAGQSVDVSGTLEQGLASPRLYITRPSGEVEEMKLGGSGAEFAASVLLKERGEHSIEVLADGAGGPQVAAVRRVFAGVVPPSRPPPEGRVRQGLAGVEAAIAR